MFHLRTIGQYEVPFLCFAAWIPITLFFLVLLCIHNLVNLPLANARCWSSKMLFVFYLASSPFFYLFERFVILWWTAQTVQREQGICSLYIRESNSFHRLGVFFTITLRGEAAESEKRLCTRDIFAFCFVLQPLVSKTFAK